MTTFLTQKMHELANKKLLIAGPASAVRFLIFALGYDQKDAEILLGVETLGLPNLNERIINGKEMSHA